MLSYSFTSEEPQDDEDIKCPKCLSFFSSITKPYILPCNHNICLNCIDSLITENNTVCPICNYNFNKNDRNSLEVNFGFLNLVIKILQTKIIFCTKCNKIYYWKDHYQSCEQKYFENGNNILEDLRTTCEEGEKIAKIINDNRGEMLNKYKKQIGNLVKNIINEIHKQYEDDIENKINNELFKTNISINFSKSKSEILNFMKLCLPYPEYFNTHEISLILDYMKSYETNIRKQSKKNRVGDNYKSAFSPPSFKQYFLTEESLNDNDNDNDYIRNKKNYETIGSYHMNKKINNYSFCGSGNYRSNRHISNINFNENGKDIISEEENDDDDYLIADNCDDEGINESDRIKVKIYHDNNISKFKKIDNGNGKEMPNLFNKKNNYQNKTGALPFKKNIIFNSQRPIKKTICKINPEKKANKFDINKLLDNDINIEEEPAKKKIIVGLKDVKVISLKKSIGSGQNSLDNKKGRVNSKLVKPNLIIPGEKMDLDNAHSFISTKNNRSNRIIFNKENYENYYSNNNNKSSQTIQIEAPSLNLLRSSDYLKRDYRFHGNVNSKKNINSIISNYNKIRANTIDEFSTNFSNTINVDHSFEQSLTRRKIINDSKNMNYSSFNTIGRESDIFSMNKIIKNFNKIKDITNKVKNYEELINFLSNNINKEAKNNMILLKNVIINNYQSLLSEISYNSNRIQKNYLLTHISDTYNILLYDPFNGKYQIKNYNLIFKNNKININAFDNSTSIVYDDNDLIFISGGDFIYDLFLIISWSTGKIIHNGKMPTQKAYHKTIFFNEKLYLIGGMAPNKKTSAECFFFDLKEKKWHILPNLKSARKNASICFYNSSILYVFRGEDDSNVLDTIEYIDVNDKKGWNLVKPIDNGYVWYPAKNSMVLTIDKDKIIICGGEDNEDNLFKDCFLFEPSTNCIYKGLDLVTSAAFIVEGCIYQDEIFTIDYKNKTQNQKAIIHTSNAKKNIWKFSYIK